MELTLSNLSDLINNEKYKAIAEEYKTLAEKLKNEVLLAYLNGENDELNKNFKHVAVEQLKVVVEFKDKVKELGLPVVEEFVKVLDDNIKNYESTIKDKLVADGIVYFTESDVKIRVANTYIALLGWADAEIEKLKKPKSEDNVMEKIKED